MHHCLGVCHRPVNSMTRVSRGLTRRGALKLKVQCWENARVGHVVNCRWVTVGLSIGVCKGEHEIHALRNGALWPTKNKMDQET